MANSIIIDSALIALIGICCCLISYVEAKVFMVLMDEDAVLSFKDYTVKTHNQIMSEEDVQVYKLKVATGHDNFLQSLLPVGTYTKLYSYTHLLNGFAVHTPSDEAIKILQEARGVRLIQEDVKMKKLTTYTPELLRIPQGVWPQLGSAEGAGEGVVIGMLDSGINPNHPSFANYHLLGGEGVPFNNGRFKGRCESGEGFPPSACNGKIVGARHFSRGAIASGDFNATRDYTSPFDVDGHGSHTASTAAGNYNVPVRVNGFSYGNASGMAPGARIAVYKAVFSFGGYMSDVVAAVDQAVEDGVDVLNLSIGPESVPSGPASFLSTLEVGLLFATGAGVLVVQAVGNDGPSSHSTLSFSPWIVSVAASVTDRKYNNTVMLGDGRRLRGTGLSPPTSGKGLHPLATAADVANESSSYSSAENCQDPESFNRQLARGKIIICSYTTDFALDVSDVNEIALAMEAIGAAGFVLAMDPDLGVDQVRGTTAIFPVPGILLNTDQASEGLWNYYNANTYRRGSRLAHFNAMARIEDGRAAVYTGQAPMVTAYSSRGPDVNNMQLQEADVLKPNIMAPGSLIWAAWSPTSEGDQYIKGHNFALVSGTSMATPHIAGVAALIKHKHRHWSPAAIASAMMTTANVTSRSGSPLLAQGRGSSAPATPFDCGSGLVDPAAAIDPGLVFDVELRQYVQFLCSVPGVDEESVKRAAGVGCPTSPMQWCSDLNTPSVAVANLVGTRKVLRRVTNVGAERETYEVIVREPTGVAVAVTPRVFSVDMNATRNLKIVLRATEATNAYAFGELLLLGNRKHEVRVPLAVFVTSTLQVKH